MVNGKTNIDLIFRNGLIDYEEAPPSDVWANVKPAIDRKRRNMFFMRSAASIAVLISVGALAYMWGYETSKEKFSAELVNINTTNEVTPVDIAIPLAITQRQTEPAAVVGIVPKKAEKEIETVAAPVIAQSEIPYEIEIYGEDFYVDESSSLIAETEEFTDNQNPLEIMYANVFTPEYRPLIYDNAYENVSTAENNRWSILAMAAPTYYSQFTTSNNELAHDIMSSDKGRASYSGGMGFAYKINKRFSVQSGFYYSAMGQELGDVTAFSGFQQVNPSKGVNNFKVLTPNGTVLANNPDVYLSSNAIPERVVTKSNIDPYKQNLNYLSNSLYQDLSYFELPLLLRYKVIDRTIGVSFVGGLSYNFLINNSVYTMNDGGKYPIGTTDGLSNLSLSSSLGMGMEYKFSKKFSFNIEPTFRYFINSSNSERIAGLHTYSLGVFSGLAYKF